MLTQLKQNATDTVGEGKLFCDCLVNAPMAKGTDFALGALC